MTPTLAGHDLTREARAMLETDLAALYREYIACLNAQDWASLGRFVQADVRYNGRLVGLGGYREMLEQNYRDIPDLRFVVQFLTCDPPRVASRLAFDCTPVATFLELPVDGRRITFAENVFYEFDADKISEVWSIIDKAAIEAQLGVPPR